VLPVLITTVRETPASAAARRTLMVPPAVMKKVVVPVVVVVGRAGEVQHHVLALDRRPHEVEVADVADGVRDALHRVAAEAAELVPIGEAADGEPPDEAVRAGHEHLGFGHASLLRADSPPARQHHRPSAPRGHRLPRQIVYCRQSRGNALPATRAGRRTATRSVRIAPGS
jgi:hypothetical protein